MPYTIPELCYRESTDPVFVLDLGRAQNALGEDEASELFYALGVFLKQPTATLGVDEYTVLGQWNNLEDQGIVKGSMDLAQARDAFWAAMDGYFIDTTKEMEYIDAYLIDLAHSYQGTPS